MKHSNIIAIIICIIGFESCVSKTINKKIQGTWVIEEFRLNEEELMWTDELAVNMLTIHKDGSCLLPIRDLSKGDKAKYKIIKSNNDYFLHISNAQDTIFNKQYLITFDERSFGDATHLTMELNSVNLWIKASR